MFVFNNLVKAEYEKTFYDLNIESITGDIINFKEYENKPILVLNTASYCGFTNQYDKLQELCETYNSTGLLVLVIPSNSFNQAKKVIDEVQEIVSVYFNIYFLLFFF